MKSILNLIAILVLWPTIWLQAGDCQLWLKGRVTDQGTGKPLRYANIFIEETGGGAVSDSAGYFAVGGLCSGEYHIRVSHLGCKPRQLFLMLESDTFVQIRLLHHEELLNELIIHGEYDDRSVQNSTTVNHSEITTESNKNLSDILESITGVSALRTGSGISKPVIHGLYGNRVSILNNGIVQSGQQWGNDHAPEIDPFFADHISVVKGASALAYGGGSLGSVVLVEPGNIEKDPHIHGEVNYIFQTNGLGHTLNGKLEKFSKWAAWQVLGTFKYSGDNRTADYYLNNTGRREYNVAARLEKYVMENWSVKAYYSLFRAQIGILRGSHIGNVTDLEEALERDVPFFTEEKFSYAIESPFQEVAHHLAKLESSYFFSDDHLLKILYGGQLNNREEFDVRRSGRSDIPALSLKQQTHSMELGYQGSMASGVTVRTGLQFQYQYNKNDPETGILPLIPDYVSNDLGVFAIFQQDKDRVFYEFGARYDLMDLEAITISTDGPRTIERFNHIFHTYSASGGLVIRAHENFDLSLEMGYAQRAPAVNELYSSGLHQGVSGIEEGRNDLVKEKSSKVLLSGEYKLRDKLFMEVLGYYQQIGNYIFLEPQDELRLTIRGAFPVFLYQQTDARIGGLDALFSLSPADEFKVVLKYEMVRGRDIPGGLSLINLPSDNVSASLAYYFKDGRRMKGSSLSMDGRYVFRQNQLQDDQDFVEAPEGYFLLGFHASTEYSLSRGNLSLNLDVENMLNASYRDYLNRQRYFADDLGINVSLGVRYMF